MLLSHPHNPTGVLHSPAELAALADLAARYGAVVVSDEIWAPLTMPGVEFTSFLAVSEVAREVGLVVSSASKAFNLAGLKCAFVINGNPERFVVRRSALSGAVGHFGALAAESALTCRGRGGGVPMPGSWHGSTCATIRRWGTIPPRRSSPRGGWR